MCLTWGAPNGRVHHQVPDEVPPSCDKEGAQDWWPPGWSAGREVVSEGDIFELLGIPPKTPAQRDA